MEQNPANTFTELGTIGIEEEFYVVDETGHPTAGTDKLVYDTAPPGILANRLDHELFKCVIETQTPVAESVDEMSTILSSVRSALVDHAKAHGYQIAAAGLHPTAEWRTLEHAGKRRYREQLDRIQYPQHRNITAGLHIHIGVDDVDKAVWIANEIRWYLPIVLSLSANSSYWNGFDTGLQSARAKIFEALPNTGIPTEFQDFETFSAFERMMIETGAVNDRGELWYDVRPHTELGTIEVRTPDSQADEWRVLALVEYVHALVCDLAERYEDGESSTDVRRELLDENKWRAIRYGHDASFIRPGTHTVSDLGEIVDRECDRLGIDGIRTLYRSESGARRQRTLRTEHGDEALCNALLI